jgi:hypothetical protein
MATRAKLFSQLAKSVDTSGTITSGGISSTVSLGATVYDSIGELPTSGYSAGEQAFVKSTSRLYINSGVGWYNVAVINNTPTIQSILDSNSGTGPFSLATDGTATTITITAQDSDGDTLTYTASADSDFNGLATISQASNVFTITPFSQDSATTTSGTITFNVTDNINIANSVQTFTLSFVSALWDETVLSIGTSSTNSLDNSTFIDRSTNAHTVTATGSPVQTAFHPYLDNWSVEYDGNSNYLLTPSVSDFNLNSGDWTIEGWFYDKLDYAGNRIFTLEGSSVSYGLIRPSNFSGQLQWNQFGTGALITSSSGVAPKNQWVHFALVSNSGTITLYVNGTSEGTTTTYPENSDTQFAIGASVLRSSVKSWQGWFSNIRVVKGTAVYTANFTPPTRKLTVVSGTSLLTCQSNRFIDNSTNNYTITIGDGREAISAFNPFGQESEYAVGENKGSVYLNGSSYMTLATSPFHMDQSDYTAECWIYPTVLGRYIMGIWSSTSASNQAWSLRTLSDGKINSEIDPGDVQIATSSGGIIKLNQWHHVALTRSGGDFRIFVDGDVVASGSSPGFNMAEGGGFMGIGAVEGLTGSPFTGYVSDVYIRKGAAKYTSAFTTPTAPVQNTDATLYLPMDNPGIFDKTGNNTLTPVGNASTSTTQTKFADTAMYFDGTGDYAKIPTTMALNTSDFTIESWIYIVSSSDSYGRIIENGAWDANDTWRINYNNTASSLTFQIGNTSTRPSINTTTSLQGAWHHIAVCRSGNTIKFFVDGTQEGGDLSYSGSFVAPTQVGEIWIGAGVDSSSSSNPANYFNGYIENLQILKGVAKYTSSFTPPTSTQGRSNQAES